jgi:protein phosphatase
MTAGDFGSLFDSYFQCFLENAPNLNTPDQPIVLPSLRRETLIRLFAQAHLLFQNEPSLVQVSSPTVVIGDIHGQITDLGRILVSFGPPDSQPYLFLGDLVDRGDFSLECATVVFLMKVIAPNSVFIIRGNHEFQDVCSDGGFLTQVIESFGTSEIYQTALTAFTYIPLAAIIDGEILCVHGGLSPGLDFVQQIRCIARPVTDWSDELTEGLVWSDPDGRVASFERSAKRRIGFLFGAKATSAFLSRNHLKMMIRGHECVSDGWQEQFDGRLLTVFSASNYCGAVQNKGAVLVIAPGAEPKKITFQPLPWRTHRDARPGPAQPGGSPAQCKILCPNLELRRSSTTVRPGRLQRHGNPSASLGQLICRLGGRPGAGIHARTGEACARSGFFPIGTAGLAPPPQMLGECPLEKDEETECGGS